MINSKTNNRFISIKSISWRSRDFRSIARSREACEFILTGVRQLVRGRSGLERRVGLGAREQRRRRQLRALRRGRLLLLRGVSVLGEQQISAQSDIRIPILCVTKTGYHVPTTTEHPRFKVSNDSIKL